MRRNVRIVFVATALGAALIACGLSAVGTFGEPPGTEGPDGETGDGMVAAEGGGGADASDEALEVYLDAEPIFDALLDANPANCLAVCDAGSCDGGTCVIACGSGTKACPADKPVVCPPGVPCEVECIAAGSCNRGVDCTQASRCTIGCLGSTTCNEKKVECTGDSCVVDCKGSSSCNRGVVCDAGSCIVRCTGPNTCNENRVECTADTCSVQCGPGSSSCNRSVTCLAKDSCTIVCTGGYTCNENALVAVADKVSVTCSGGSTCNRGVKITAGDGGVRCSGLSACASLVVCDGGRCQASCANTLDNNTKLCCKATTCLPPQASNCAFTNQGCPP